MLPVEKGDWENEVCSRHGPGDPRAGLGLEISSVKWAGPGRAEKSVAWAS